MYWYLKVLKNYFNFKGRASRKEYWMFIFINFLIETVFFVTMLTVGDIAATLSGIYSLALFIPTMAVTVRRFHDVHRSGWLLLGVYAVAGVGAAVGSFVDSLSFFILFLIVMLVIVIWIWYVLLKAGDVGDNKYGPDPQIEIANMKNAG